jgi:prepilin-type N-terminal cleavage/methylation domain-containing protein
MKLVNRKGFTLVELLIVIGLLGAIALIVISAINPIEQANRARDTKYKADAGQLISAIDRYFVTISAFPWMTNSPATYPSADTAFNYVSAQSDDVGLCGATCTVDGLLIQNNELKTEFKQRDFVKGSPTLTNQIMVGKDSGSSTSVYACFVPLSKSVRDKACTDGKVYTLATSVRTSVATSACVSTSTNWSTSPYYVCLPE